MVSSMPTTIASTPARYISGRQVVRYGIPRRRIGQLVDAGLLRTWRLPVPGAPTRFCEPDVLKLLPGAAAVDRGGAS
jgi:hypothetical protein